MSGLAAWVDGAAGQDSLSRAQSSRRVGGGSVFDWECCSPADDQGQDSAGGSPGSPPETPPESPGPPEPLRRPPPPATSLAPAMLSPRGATRPEAGRGEISLCVRLRPCPEGEPCAAVEAGEVVRLRPCGSGSSSGVGRPDVGEAYQCDHAFGPGASQELVYARAVEPIVEAVLRGYNGAVIAYGQTGAGKTHTMIGGKAGKSHGVAPRAIAAIFAALAHRDSWRVDVSVLEVYSERVRDLLAPAGAGAPATCLELHEGPRADSQQQGGQSFRCPGASQRPARGPDEVLAALWEGTRRRETARTDMNSHSSRSHLVLALCISQSDREAGATLRSRLHLVDLAGSERLKRSASSNGSGAISPRLGAKAQGSAARAQRIQRREAGEINRSLSQLALVIQRLTAPGAPQYVPYRDSTLTRLLAESFGGSSKTCLIIACSPALVNREETRASMDFGRRAKLVRNKPQINLEVEAEPSVVMKALMARELAKVQRERDAALRERDELLAENAALRQQHEAEAGRLEGGKGVLRQQLLNAAAAAANASERCLAQLAGEGLAFDHGAAAGRLRPPQQRQESVSSLRAQVSLVALPVTLPSCIQHQEDLAAEAVEQPNGGGGSSTRRSQEAAGGAMRLQAADSVASLRMQDETAALHHPWREKLPAWARPLEDPEDARYAQQREDDPEEALPSSTEHQQVCGAGETPQSTLREALRDVLARCSGEEAVAAAAAPQARRAPACELGQLEEAKAAAWRGSELDFGAPHRRSDGDLLRIRQEAEGAAHRAGGFRAVAREAGPRHGCELGAEPHRSGAATERAPGARPAHETQLLNWGHLWSLPAGSEHPGKLRLQLDGGDGTAMSPWAERAGHGEEVPRRIALDLASVAASPKSRIDGDCFLGGA